MLGNVLFGVVVPSAVVPIRSRGAANEVRAHTQTRLVRLGVCCVWPLLHAGSSSNFPGFTRGRSTKPRGKRECYKTKRECYTNQQAMRETQGGLQGRFPPPKVHYHCVQYSALKFTTAEHVLPITSKVVCVGLCNTPGLALYADHTIIQALTHLST